MTTKTLCVLDGIAYSANDLRQIIAERNELELRHIPELETKIEQLNKCCTQRGARMQKLRKWIAGAVYPLSPEEAFTDIEGWFDEDGVPK